MNVPLRPASPAALPPALVRRRRAMLVLLALVFFGPLAVAFWMYYGGVWQPPRTVNNGELISPARPLPALALQTPSGTPTAADFLRGRWSFVYIGSGECDATCRTALADTRAVRLALDRDAPRVQRVFLFHSSCCDRRALADDHPDLIVAWLDERDGARLLEPFPAIGGQPARDARRIWVVDPLGNLMMSYPAGTAKKAMLTDLEKLLRLSHIG